MNTMIALGRGVKTPLFYAGTLDRITYTDCGISFTAELRISVSHVKTEQEEIITEGED